MTQFQNYRFSPSIGAIVFAAIIAAPGIALADPPAQNIPGDDPIPPVFCIRITDMERVTLATPTGNDFALEFELLNWSNKAATGFRLASSIGTTNVNGVNPTIVGAGIDRDGRGGAVGGTDIDATGVGLTAGQGTFDPVAIHSGRGRGDIGGLLNDWTATTVTATSAVYNAAPGGGTALTNRDLVGAATPGGITPTSLVPGLGLDALGDTAVDGGPGPYTPAGTVPTPGTGNVLDGFTLTITDWDIGEQLTLNWFFEDSLGQPIGTAGQNNVFGFGASNFVRIPVGGALPGAVFVGNTGFNTGSFYDNVHLLPNPAQFAAELGVGITADFLNPADNVFDAETNTTPVPAPSSLLLFGSGFLMLMRAKRRSRKVA